MSFGDIYGQKKQISVLRNAVKSGHVSHAYLFYGMEGTGKRTTAKTFAKVLNCEEEELDSCDKCISCRKIEQNKHPNFTLLEPGGVAIKIEEIRNIQNQLKFAVSEGRKRVFVIAEADKMSDPAANALLKTLEEPKPSNIFILITSRPHNLPETILSRCQKIRFNPIKRDTVTSFLIDKLSMDEKTASLLALSSEGSIKKALEEGKKEHFDLRYDLIKKVSSMDTRTDLSEWLFLADDLGKDKNSISEKLYILAGWYRDVMLYRETGNTDRLIYKDFCEKIKRLSENISGSDILECIKIIDKAHDSIAKNVNIRLVLEFMMLKLACACSSELNLGR